MKNQTAHSFEDSFMASSIKKHTDLCDQYELAPLFIELFKDKSPILEAGCGSGRWCAWLQKHSIQSDGIDWSEKLCERASKEISKSKFIACDVQATPFKDNAYGGILALGTIEHIIDGPGKALNEFHRLLRNDGVAIITVPYGGSPRLFLRNLRKPLVFLKSSPSLRRLFGKASGSTSLTEARSATKKEWHPRFTHGSDGWSFFEYEFDKAQMRSFLLNAGFEIKKEFVGFQDEGILHNLGRAMGTWNHEHGRVDFTLLGRLLRKTIPVDTTGHMLCYVVTKNRSMPGDKTEDDENRSNRS